MDPGKLAVTGFSINGKYAFVAAVFDERIDVCIPGAAGASGPSPWRYVYTGHEYDWSGTLFAAAEGSGVSSVQIASGTEMMANSIRHNRVRETELFRQFLTPGNFYKRLPGAYGYGTRLPYDQNDLIATLAPRAIVLENTVNDYNDGCEADSLGLQIAKSVYNTLGYDGNDLVKFNQRSVQPGEPHGSDAAQRSRTAQYLNHYFYGTQMSEETDTYLNTDPFNLPVSNGGTQSPYDYYYGGFNTITGGQGGVDGRDGWYYYSFPEETVMLDTSELDQLYQSLVNKDLTGYTESSAAAFREALDNAASVLNRPLEDTESNRELVSDAAEALRKANEGLVEKEKPVPEPPVSKPDDTVTDNTADIDTASSDEEDDSDGFSEAVDVNWSTVARQLNAAERESNVNVITGSQFVVPQNVLQGIAGRKVTLALQLGNGFAFSISGNELKKADTSFGLSVSAASGIPEEVRRQVLEGAYASREFSTKESGTFSFPVNLHLNFGAANAGRQAFLYYYDEMSGQMQLTGTFTVTETGQAMFGFRRGGRYIAVVADQAIHGKGSYIVMKGDTLSRIAIRHGVNLKSLIKANPQIKDINRIYPGQKIRIR